ncbi:T9SS type A sorting domain-containing protein [Rhodocaloribacter sp.]
MIKSRLALLWLLGAMAAPGLVFAQPDTKVDSLRWMAMQWRKEGKAEMANWKDSLYACITTEEDDGSGILVEPGDGEGISVETPGPDFDQYMPGRGLTVVWEGRDEGDTSVPFDVAIVDFVYEDDPEDGEGPGLGIGTIFPNLDFDTYRVVITKDDTIVNDTLVTDPGPDPEPPGPFPFPDPPTIVWIDLSNGSDFPDLLCDEHGTLRGDDIVGLAVGSQLERETAVGPEVGYVLELGVVMPMKVRGSGKIVDGNRVIIIPHNAANVPQYITSARVIPRHMMEDVFSSASLWKFGLEHTAFGNPLFTATANTLEITDIAATGEDGIETDLIDGTTGLFVDLAPVTLLNGDGIQWDLTGAIDLVHYEFPFLTMEVLGEGTRSAITVKADPVTNWDAFDVQAVKNGTVLREVTIANNGTFNVPARKIGGFGRATMSEQGWDGFFINFLRGAKEIELRFIPQGADLGGLTLDETAFHFIGVSAGFKVEIDGVSAFLGSAGNAGGGAPVRLAAPAREAHAPVLLGNYPEPFNPSTTISFALPEVAYVRLEVFDITGRRVAVLVDGERPAGQYAARFDASRLASGLYLYRLRAGGMVQSKTMMLLK